MENWCRLCRKEISKDRIPRYCIQCSSKISAGKPNIFNRYIDNKRFVELSFRDVVPKTAKWEGFKENKYDESIIKILVKKFKNLNYSCSFLNREKSRYIDKLTNKSLYLCSTETILKVGQSTNPYGRFNKYFIYGNPRLDVFHVETWNEQDIMEHKIRNYLEFLGYMLPEDNSCNRLKYIHQCNIKVDNDKTK